MTIFKGISNSPQFQDTLLAGNAVGMSDSGCINGDLFLDWLKHFLKRKSEGRVLLILNNNRSHTSYEAITFCKDHDVDAIVQPPQSTRVPALDKTFLNPSRYNTTKMLRNGCTEIQHIHSLLGCLIRRPNVSTGKVIRPNMNHNCKHSSWSSGLRRRVD
jgi:hypothetical protein